MMALFDMNDLNLPDLSVFQDPTIQVTITSLKDGTMKVLKGHALALAIVEMTGSSDNASATAEPIIVGAEMPIRVAVMTLLKRLEDTSPETVFEILKHYKDMGGQIQPDNGEGPI